jgi:CHAD domain-containing protein
VHHAEDFDPVQHRGVATRRLRASLQVVAGVYDPKLIRRYRRGLRQIADSLGAVRDGDVFLEHITEYQNGLPEAERGRLGRLSAAVSAERAQARERLLADLHAKRYHKLQRDFATFLTTPGSGTLESIAPGVEQRVRDFAGSAIWRRYELWRAYEVILPNAGSETLHQARIAGKRFRYTLEFFADALPNVDQALAPLIALQENLGALQDGVTARSHVAALGLADDPGTLDYLAAREQDRDALLAELPRLWEKVASATYRRRLFEMIVKL